MRPEEQAIYDEAVSLAYWLAKQLGEHVDVQTDRGEMLIDTVKRLLAMTSAAELEAMAEGLRD